MTVIVAEIGSNHLGDFNRAKEMIHAIAENGGHIAKLQIFQPQQYPHNIPTPEAWLPELECYANSLGLGFLCSWFYIPHDMPPIAKIAYSQRHNFSLIRAFEKAGIKLIVSGDKNTIWPKDCIKLLCIPKYPATVKDYEKMGEEEYNYYNGFSDHTIGNKFLLTKKKYKELWVEKHFKLGDEIEKKSPDSGDFAMTPSQLLELSRSLL